MGQDWRVSFNEQGRDGYVIYEEGGKALSFYWALGGGEVVASVSIGDEAEWRADYPEFADRRAEIISRIAEESIRMRSPTSRAEMDETGRFLNFIAGGSLFSSRGARVEAVGRQSEAAAFYWRFNRVKTRMGFLALLLIVVAGGAMLAGRSFLTVKTTGTPAGASARAGDFIATPISWLEPYVPSLDRNHAKDRYSTGLLLHSAADETLRRYVKVAEGRSGSDSVNVRISGTDGDRIWFDAPETTVVNAREARVLSLVEASAAKEPPRPAGAAALAVYATAERRLEGLLAAPGESGAPARIGVTEEFFNAAFLRATSYGDLLTSGDGDFFAVYWTKRYREGLMVVARVSKSGDVVWRTETEIGRFDEALPDPSRPALVGARPREDGKLSEPLLVVMDAITGGAVTHSLLVK